jgi:hypothetical protein
MYLCALTMTHFHKIQIAWHLDAYWTDWFDRMSITLEKNGIMLLSRPMPDQPACSGSYAGYVISVCCSLWFGCAINKI